MIHFAFALAVIGGLAVGAWLVVSGHPWFALLVFLITTNVQMSHTKSGNKDKKEPEK